MHEKFMRLAFDEAQSAVQLGDGPPFGAVIARNFRFVVCAHNEIVKNKDPTAHSEMTAIRRACKVLQTTDLSGCVLYASCEPCPMCLAACLGANIQFVFYGSSREDAKKAGYKTKDFDFYQTLAKNSNNSSTSCNSSSNGQTTVAGWKKSFLKRVPSDEANSLYCAKT